MLLSSVAWNHWACRMPHLVQIIQLQIGTTQPPSSTWTKRAPHCTSSTATGVPRAWLNVLLASVPSCSLCISASVILHRASQRPQSPPHASSFLERDSAVSSSSSLLQATKLMAMNSPITPSSPRHSCSTARHVPSSSVCTHLPRRSRTITHALHSCVLC